MNPYRGEGVGWLSIVFIALGAAIVIVNGLHIDFWFLSVLDAIPFIFGLTVLACGIALVVAGFIGATDRDR